MFRPDWKPVTASDPAYEADKEKWSAPAYGFDPVHDVPDTGPDGHTRSDRYWDIVRTPFDGSEGSRFIATKLTNPYSPLRIIDPLPTWP